MKLNCAQTQELLSDDKISTEVKQHIAECYSCSDIAKGLMLLSIGIDQANRTVPPASLNDSVLSFLDNESAQLTEAVPKAPVCNSYQFKISHAGIIILVCSVLSLVRNSYDSPEVVTLTALELARKSIAELMQVAIFSIGTLCLFFSGLRKGLVIAAVASTLILTEIINLALR